MRGKLNPRYIRLYEILQHAIAMAYQLALPPKLARVSTLRKYLHGPTHVLHYELLELRDDMTYDKFPMCILASQEKEHQNRMIPYVKVQGSNHTECKVT